MATVTVLTTLPSFEDDMIHTIRSERLIIRPLVYPKDLKAYWAIRSQLAAMTGSRTGLPDATMEQTDAKLKRLQPPYRGSHVYFGIFLRGDNDSEGELIGDGGVHGLSETETGWPEFGYKFKKEYWGQGYASEFAKSFLRFWFNLPRSVCQIEVALNSVATVYEDSAPSRSGEEIGTVPHVEEQMCAWTRSENGASQRVLQKSGFETFDGLDNGYINWRRTFPSCRDSHHRFSEPN